MLAVVLATLGVPVTGWSTAWSIELGVPRGAADGHPKQVTTSG